MTIRRGDVFQTTRRLGFAAARERERVVIVQATGLNAALASLLAVPLCPEADAHGVPLTVSVSAREAGSAIAHAALPSWLTAMPPERLLPDPVGRLESNTLAQIDEKLRILLDL